MMKPVFLDSTNLEDILKDRLFSAMAGLRKPDFEEEADPDLFPHITHATALQQIAELHVSQLKAGEKLNSLKQWVAVEGGFGTGKTRLIETRTNHGF